MQPPIRHTIQGQTFWLSAQRVVFWEEQKALIVSDLHFGKTGHFRKAGIAVPQSVFKEDLQRLLALIHFFNPQKIIAVGDLFHSRANLELDLFRRWRMDVGHLAFHLVKGNHDILEEDWYTEAGISTSAPSLHLPPIRFTHDHCPSAEPGFTFCGHIHPGILVQGLGRQSLRFPCFYFTETHCILPAFSRFTGLANVERSKAESIYAIVENALIKM